MSDNFKNKIGFFSYKGYPLVRCGDTLYYGNMADEYVTMLKIEKTTKVFNIDVADKIKIYLMSTNTELNPIEAIKKTSEKDGLYEALDLASAWLQRSID